MLTKLRMFVFVAAMAAFLGAASVDAQKIRRVIEVAPPEPEANPSYNLDQCANGGFNNAGEDAITCTGAAWQNGNLNESNSRWAESQFVAYRARFENLVPTTTYNLVISYDVFHNGTHATDYLGNYNGTETTGNDPCSGVSNADCTSNSFTTFGIPVETDPALDNPVGQQNGVFTMWGGTISAAVYCQDVAGTDCAGDTFDSGNIRYMKLTFTSTVANPVIAWGGHLAWRVEWDPELTAGTELGGSPYHMAIEGLNGQGGRQDRSLKIALEAVLRIVKDAVPVPGATIPDFEFYTQGPFGLSQFFLNDNETQSSSPITRQNLGVPITVGETNLPQFWSLDVPTAANCVRTGSTNTFPFTFSQSGLSYTLSLGPGDDVTCTFRNVQTVPTAAPAYVAGRVTDAYGRGISSTRVTVFNASTGAATTVYTNTFGYYRINDLPVGDFYVMNVSHRRYSFVSGSTSFTLDSDLSGLNFQASN